MSNEINETEETEKIPASVVDETNTNSSVDSEEDQSAERKLTGLVAKAWTLTRSSRSFGVGIGRS